MCLRVNPEHVEVLIVLMSFDNVQDKLSLAASLLYVAFFPKAHLETSMNFSTVLICILIAHSMEIFCNVLLFSSAN